MLKKQLQGDGLVGSWEYLEWDETLAGSDGWARGPLWGCSGNQPVECRIVYVHY
ncbi:hypothetical protein GCM10028778_15080 [Barrientosiimonas marina]